MRDFKALTVHFVGWHNWRWALRESIQRIEYHPERIGYRRMLRILFWQIVTLQPCTCEEGAGCE